MEDARNSADLLDEHAKISCPEGHGSAEAGPDSRAASLADTDTCRSDDSEQEEDASQERASGRGERGEGGGVEDSRSTTLADLGIDHHRSGTRNSKGQTGRKPAVFFGIVDLKYDPCAQPGDRVKVLELGDGRTSKFSGCGSAISKNFEREYRIRSCINRGTLVNHKKMMHDVFAQCGYQHLRPRQAAFAREYHEHLALDVFKAVHDIDRKRECHGREVVLKLCNCCRGAGVVVALGWEDLDQKLKTLLSPRAMKECLGQSITDRDSSEEQHIHWWGNECPIFIAEQRVSMQEGIGAPLREGDGEGHRETNDSFDATMRVGFVLEKDDNQLRCSFLGSYWKLPQEPLGSEDCQRRCVSVARRGTCPAAAEHSAEVYEALRPALQEVFSHRRAGAHYITKFYAADPLLCAFTLARHAAERSIRLEKQSSTQEDAGADPEQDKMVADFFQAALQMASSCPAKSLATLVVRSYIHRLFGSFKARTCWECAAQHWRRALELHPRNARARYLLGTHWLRLERWQDALAELQASLLLDPDFKGNYVNLGALFLHLGNPEAAIKVSRLGLLRHPRTPQSAHNLALAWCRRFASQLCRSAAGGQDQGSQERPDTPEAELPEASVPGADGHPMPHLKRRDLEGLARACDELRLAKILANGKRRPQPIGGMDPTSPDSLLQRLDAAVAWAMHPGRDDGRDPRQKAVSCEELDEVETAQCRTLCEAIDAASSGLSPATITNLRA